MSKRRVVVTGIGMVSPLGVGHDYVWNQLINSASGIKKITSFNTDEFPAKVAGIIPKGSYEENKFDVAEWMDIRESRRVDSFIHYSKAATKLAMEASGYTPETEEQKSRAGVAISAGVGGLQGIYEASVQLEKGQYRRISPFFIPSVLINLLSGHASMDYGFKGPNISYVTACATSTHSIGESFRLIKDDMADVMLAGGAEAPVIPLGIAGFARMNALSTKYNDTPEKASRPWDKGRDGFVMGEGAGVFVLEELEHAKKRGATIYAEVVGYGMSGDAEHITAPSKEGLGAALAMTNALKLAQLNPEEVSYINAHGTSTPLGDVAEVKAIKRLFGDHAYNLKVSSTKSATGHLLGAAGAIEAAFCIGAINSSIVPPTLNLDDPDEGCDLDFVPHKAKEFNVDVAVSNSFGFGGTNASIVLKKFA